jgi:hypothetical protein
LPKISFDGNFFCRTPAFQPVIMLFLEVVRGIGLIGMQFGQNKESTPAHSADFTVLLIVLFCTEKRKAGG